MKLIITILRDVDQEKVSHALTTSNFRVTMIASTGGFLRHGSATLLVGVEDEQLDDALQVIRSNCSASPEPGLKSATIFVLKVAEFIQF